MIFVLTQHVAQFDSKKNVRNRSMRRKISEAKMCNPMITRTKTSCQEIEKLNKIPTFHFVNVKGLSVSKLQVVCSNVLFSSGDDKKLVRYNRDF